MEPHNLEFGLVVFIRGCQFKVKCMGGAGYVFFCNMAPNLQTRFTDY